MTPENFCYWLQGFTELQPGMEQPTPAQWKAITEHLQHVFQKVTPKVEQPVGPAYSTPAGANDPRKKDPILDAWDRLTVSPLPYDQAEAVRERWRNQQLRFTGIPLLGDGITITC